MREREDREREKNGEEETDIGSQGEKVEGEVLREKEGEKEEGGDVADDCGEHRQTDQEQREDEHYL